jgi:hypothetical protein
MEDLEHSEETNRVGTPAGIRWEPAMGEKLAVRTTIFRTTETKNQKCWMI